MCSHLQEEICVISIENVPKNTSSPSLPHVSWQFFVIVLRCLVITCSSAALRDLVLSVLTVLLYYCIFSVALYCSEIWAVSFYLEPCCVHDNIFRWNLMPCFNCTKQEFWRSNTARPERVSKMSARRRCNSQKHVVTIGLLDTMTGWNYTNNSMHCMCGNVFKNTINWFCKWSYVCLKPLCLTVKKHETKCIINKLYYILPCRLVICGQENVIYAYAFST